MNLIPQLGLSPTYACLWFPVWCCSLLTPVCQILVPPLLSSYPATLEMCKAAWWDVRQAPGWPEWLLHTVKCKQEILSSFSVGRNPKHRKMVTFVSLRHFSNSDLLSALGLAPTVHPHFFHLKLNDEECKRSAPVRRLWKAAKLPRHSLIHPTFVQHFLSARLWGKRATQSMIIKRWIYHSPPLLTTKVPMGSKFQLMGLKPANFEFPK